MAFSFGAVVAALAGTLFAAQQISVFPTDFDTPILILIYAGADPRRRGQHRRRGRSAALVIIGHATTGCCAARPRPAYLFYGLILLTLVAKLRPWRRLAVVLAATVALGFAAHAIVGAISARAVAGRARQRPAGSAPRCATG